MYTFKPYYNIYIYNKNFRTQEEGEGGIVPLFGNCYYVTFTPMTGMGT